MTVGNILMIIWNMHVVELLLFLLFMAIALGLLQLFITILAWIFNKIFKG